MNRSAEMVACRAINTNQSSPIDLIVPTTVLHLVFRYLYQLSRVDPRFCHCSHFWWAGSEVMRCKEDIHLGLIFIFQSVIFCVWK